MDRILVPPKKVIDLTKELTFQFSFPGPANPGIYNFCLFMKSDRYLGTDVVHDVRFRVQEPEELLTDEQIHYDQENDSFSVVIKLLGEIGLATGPQQHHESDK